MQTQLCKGTFCGGEIETGTFCGGELEPGTFHGAAGDVRKRLGIDPEHPDPANSLWVDDEPQEPQA